MSNCYRYSLNDCEELMCKYVNAGGMAITVDEGCLGLGIVVCFAENMQYAVIKEYYINHWSSGHTVAFYDELPNEYQEMLDAVY